jgi:hypothetical protein
MAGSSFDPEMGLEDGIVILRADPLASVVGSEPGGLKGEGLLDTQLAGQDVALERNSTLVGSAIVGAGHGEFSVVTFREIAMDRHCVYLGFRIAAPDPGSGCCQTHLFDS